MNLRLLSYRPVFILILLAWNGRAFCAEIDDAARTGDLAKVQSLLKDNPALVSSTFFDDWTPLCEAADNGYFYLAKVLVANKADVNVKAKGGRSPLFLATMSGYNNIVHLLLSNGADPDVKDDNAVTPLHLAVWDGDKKTAKLLLDAQADVNARNKQGETPLAWAKERGNQAMIKLLLAHGAQL